MWGSEFGPTGTFQGGNYFRGDIEDKVKNMLIKFKEGLFISAFRENLYEQNPTSLNFPLWNFQGLQKRVILPIGAEVEASTGKGEWKFVFLLLKSYSAHLLQKNKNWGIHIVPKYLREIKFAHVYQGVEPKVENWDEDKNKKWI